MDQDNDTANGNENIRQCALALKDYLLNGDVETALQVAGKLTQQECLALPRTQSDLGQTLMSLGVSFEQVPFVSFLLDECRDDVNRRFVFGDYTALCLAVRRCNMELVRILVEHGADVNAAGPDQRTPVHLACERSLALVQYLVENGADVNIPDVSRETPLMCAMTSRHWSQQMCLLLVREGASLNAVDDFGNSALHHAARSRHAGPLAVHTLLLCGTDPWIQNRSGEDVLLTAALSGSPDTLKVLVLQLSPAKQRCADLCSLLAAQILDQRADFATALKFWKKSAAIRRKAPQDTPLVVRNPPYFGAVEALDTKSLRAIAGNVDAMYLQALACRGRILGRSHRETIHWLSARALHYVRSPRSYQLGICMYKYAAASCDGSTFIQPLVDIRPHLEFYRLFSGKFQEDTTSVRFLDVVAILRVMIEASKCAANARRPEPCSRYTILQLSVNVIDLLCRLKSSEAESVILKQLVRALVLTKCETRYAENALSVAVNSCPSLYLDGKILNVFPAGPSGAAVEELLKSGADVNAVDSAGNTPLHLAVERFSDPSSTQRAAWVHLIDVLLRCGAHVDIRNAKGEIAADRLPSSFHKLEYITLQCLAARAVRQHGVPYRSCVPPMLAKFVDLH